MLQLNSVFGYIDDWFRDLHEKQPIDQFNLKDIDPVQDEETRLDLLAKDLELLLDDDSGETTTAKIEHKQETEPEFYNFSHHLTDELALSDPTIGHFCTIETSSTEKEKPARNIINKTVFMESSNDDVNSSQTHWMDTSKNVHTPMPRDHDYLARTITKESSGLHLRQPKNIKVVHEVPSVLNFVVMKRFAKFSKITQQ
jgi:hypothetical protein